MNLREVKSCWPWLFWSASRALRELSLHSFEGITAPSKAANLRWPNWLFFDKKAPLSFCALRPKRCDDKSKEEQLSCPKGLILFGNTHSEIILKPKEVEVKNEQTWINLERDRLPLGLHNIPMDPIFLPQRQPKLSHVSCGVCGILRT